MIEINLTIVIQVVQFLILVFILNRLLFKPITDTIEKREEKIAGWEEKARELHETVRARFAEYENRLEQARVGARQQQAELTRELEQREEERVREASARAAQEVAETQKTMEEETERLRGELREQAREMSQLLAEKVLGRKVS
jgi:F-type H+-transporting ATPase subunit b